MLLNVAFWCVPALLLIQETLVSNLASFTSYPDRIRLPAILTETFTSYPDRIRLPAILTGFQANSDIVDLRHGRFLQCPIEFTVE
jgi:hypothetical protein